MSRLPCFTYILWCCYIVARFRVITGRTIFKEVIAPTPLELSFMKQFGYLPSAAGENADFVYTPLSISAALVRLQQYAGIPTTGEVDDATKVLFSKRRCGNKDITDNSSRRKRYVVVQAWDKRIITYRVMNGTGRLSKERVEQLMSKALAMWAPYGGLTFQKLDSGEADIKVSFESGDHGDGFSFDGPGRVVAHAYAPPHGAMHFDNDEEWGEGAETEDENTDITDFIAVAAHEAGHALGLAHSSERDSVMYPYYQVPVLGLRDDDIGGMRELYLNGPHAAQSTERHLSTHSTPAVAQEPDLCSGTYDTMQVIFGKIYVFQKEWMWVMNNKKEVEPGYPRKFRSLFVQLPAHVTAIKSLYENLRGDIVVFYEKRYWQFNGTYQLVKKGNIKRFKIPAYVRDVTTAFLSNYNNKTYLVAEERFWRYDEATSKMDLGYPKSMAAWRNITYPVNAALVWEGDTYFFQNKQFWRFDNTMVSAHKHYPLPTAPVWFPCPSDTT